MRLVQIGGALLVAIAVFGGAPVARAQDGGYGSSSLPAGGGAPSPRACGGDGAAPERSAYAYGRQACLPAGDRGASSREALCTNPYRGYSGLLYSDSTPYYAAGGEAYSYAGYGSRYSPYLTDAEAPPATRDGTTESSGASLDVPACVSPVG
jgi:hypothetical protein